MIFGIIIQVDLLLLLAQEVCANGEIAIFRKDSCFSVFNASIDVRSVNLFVV